MTHVLTCSSNSISLINMHTYLLTAFLLRLCELNFDFLYMCKVRRTYVFFIIVLIVYLQLNRYEYLKLNSLYNDNGG